MLVKRADRIGVQPLGALPAKGERNPKRNRQQQGVAELQKSGMKFLLSSSHQGALDLLKLFFDKSTMFFLKSLRGGSVVGTIPDEAALKTALRLKPGAVDFLELRVDAFADSEARLKRLEKALPGLKCFPLIVTVRHPREGGENGLGVRRRRELFRRFLPHAALVDVELRSARALKSVIAAARVSGAGVILSYHNFRNTPSLKRLQALRRAARGAEVFKVATTVNRSSALARLLEFLTPGKPALSVMGMGILGQHSRIMLGCGGSVLNYGYLGKRVQVPGQWPAVELKALLRSK